MLYPTRKRITRFTRLNSKRATVFFAGALGLACLVFGEAASAVENRSCASKTGYDPAHPGMVNERELANTEGSFLRCVYARIRETIIPRSTVPDDYEQFINQYKQMTRDIASGNETRSQRSSRASKLLDAIAVKERASMGDSQGGAPLDSDTLRSILALTPST